MPLLHVQLHRSRSLEAEVKERLVTVESTIVYALEESLNRSYPQWEVQFMRPYDDSSLE